MIAYDMVAAIRRQIADSVDVSQFDDGRIEISVPIMYDDGNHCTCYAVRHENGWQLTDYGDVVSRASVRDVNLLSKGYASRLRQITGFYGIAAEKDGSLAVPVQNDDFGRAVFAFAQTCLAVQSLAKTKPERE